MFPSDFSFFFPKLPIFFYILSKHPIFHIFLKNLIINAWKSCVHRNLSLSFCGPQTPAEMQLLLYFHRKKQPALPRGPEMFFSMYIEVINKFGICLIVLSISSLVYIFHVFRGYYKSF